jgi:hypothetical protein
MRLLARALSAAVVAVLVTAAVPAAGQGLTRTESARLEQGETIIREKTLENGSRRYVGGLTYTVLHASAAEVMAVLEDADSLRRVLPRTKSARVVGVAGKDQLVELTQGNALVQAEYTIRVRRSSPECPAAQTEESARRPCNEFRFWLDPSRPHGIDDAWGFFRLVPFSGPSGEERVLLTYGVLADVGPGIVRNLFEERVRAALLSVPQLVRRYVAEVRRPVDGSPKTAIAAPVD